MKITRITLAILLTAFTIWYIKQGLKQTEAQKVESFIEHSEIKP